MSVAPWLPDSQPDSPAESWFAAQGWTPHAFQRETWAAHARGESGLLHVPTGAGKTYAALWGPLAELFERPLPRGLRLLYLSPLRAVSRDVEAALRRPIDDLGLELRVESRTGDTSSSVRQRQRRLLPEVLVTTPESLSLLLSYADAPDQFSRVDAVIVDEWHELLGSKRGTQTELALARLRRFSPGVRTWALSATLANLDEAAQAAVGVGVPPTIITADLPRPLEITTVVPRQLDTFPMAGHLGLGILNEVLAELDIERSTLLFCNTRSFAELWYQALLMARPEWEPWLALHHGSLEREERERAEAGLKDGSVRLCVCTSSLDLGVDFPEVERVVQVGSVKGVARLLQRAGRSGHRPGEAARIVCAPTHALELVEVAAAREALAAGELEPRRPLARPLDVLTQHLVTCALGGGFVADELYDEVRGTAAFADLSRSDFDWTLGLVCHGGRALRAYEQYQRVVEVDGRHVCPDRRVGQLHRLNIGTIVSDASVEVRLVRGASLGRVEESFAGRLRPGDEFVFAGRRLEFVRLRETVCQVRPARRKRGTAPRWQGGKLAISESLSAAMRRVVAAARDGRVETAELAAAMPVLELQARLSALPAADELLAEVCRTREGWHLFLYPFEGRLVHEGLAAVIALRLARLRSATFSLSVNEYGIELLCPEAYPYREVLEAQGAALFTTHGLLDDTIDSLNLTELARRQFREIARVSGLVLPAYPGRPKTARQMQANASLLFDVFRQYDPDNPLLLQARREVMDQHFEQARLAHCLRRLAASRLLVAEPRRPSPFGFPLLIDRAGATLSTESLLERIARMKQQWDEDLSTSTSPASD